MNLVRPGLERLAGGDVPQLRGRRVGLVTNPNGTDHAFRSSVSLLAGGEHCTLAALFGPEHGIRGNAQAGDTVGNDTDPQTGLPVHSLYGATKRPTPQMLDGLDVMLIDLQDLGARFTTYISTLVEVMHAAQSTDIEVVVLDRPNPLSGTMVRGNMPVPGFESFVGIHPVPTLHGLTLGEFGRLVARDRDWRMPQVVTMTGWERTAWFDDTDLPWIMPSPNMPTLEALTLYGGTCLIEGTTVSEGRGTTRPFELIGAPGIDPERLAADLTARDLPGVAFRPASFQPRFSKHAGEMCGGVQVHLVDRRILDAPVLGIHLLDAVRRHDPDFSWHANSPKRFFIDLLLGDDGPRQALEAGTTPTEIVTGWTEARDAFVESRRDMLLYG